VYLLNLSSFFGQTKWREKLEKACLDVAQTRCLDEALRKFPLASELAGNTSGDGEKLESSSCSLKRSATPQPLEELGFSFPPSFFHRLIWFSKFSGHSKSLLLCTFSSANLHCSPKKIAFSLELVPAWVFWSPSNSQTCVQVQMELARISDELRRAEREPEEEEEEEKGEEEEAGKAATGGLEKMWACSAS